MQESVPVLIGGVSLDAFLAFLFTFIGFLFLGNLAYLLLRRALDGHVSRGTAKWTAAILQYGITIGGIYASARHFLAFDLTAFVASLGILGIVVAFSSRQIIQNAIAGILITINRPVQLEEWVIVSGRPETGPGKVQDISFTTTTLRGLDGGLVLTPNSSIITSKVINYSRAGLLEVSIPLAVPVTADLARVQEIALRAAHDHPRILPHVEPAERSAVQNLFDLPYIGRLSSDLPRPGLALFEPKMQVSSIKEDWVRLTVRVWIREIPGKDQIVSEYLDTVIERLKAEDLLAEKKWEDEPAPETQA
ncbi:mechanosensitive ion channel family protein [Methanoculleus sp. UBA303]|jgi:small-conductance mechanosensitive channel|uniref:mechanosensitive ion channel family protein n=1 Tax=Methanoculleus sp. UBA303 TaxID=1915497 RepID=UPI0025FEDE1B|nr:mechanosensitive ion channel domain-containing protein [Methanoculleus sp. UBA303]MDD3932504.1 mechanosensitive ion channel [Methanoculleus sp.]